MIPKANNEEMQMTSSTSRITIETTRDFFLETNTFTLQKAVFHYYQRGIGHYFELTVYNLPPISSSKK